MYIIFFNKSTSVVLGIREDLSSPTQTEEHWLSLFLSDRSITDGSVGSAVLSGVKLDDFEPGKYLYNAATNTASENPSFVPPAPAPEPEPTTA